MSVENRYAIIINEETKQVQVGVGCPDEYYIEIGMTLMDVEYAYDGNWYIAGYAPIKPEPPAPTEEEQRLNRSYAYRDEVDPITAHIQRLRDEEPESEKIAELLTERVAKVAEIKERYPYQEQKQPKG